jgi:outer membrane protein
MMAVLEASRLESLMDGSAMFRTLVIVTGVAVCAPAVQAQTPPSAQAHVPQVFTLPDALQFAVDHYPTVKVALEQVNASMAGVGVAKAAYLPRLDGLWQTNRATVNNVTGLLLPQSVVPGISGPPPASASSASTWGSAAGALFSWEVYDFGLRAAGVHGAQAAVTRARADESITRLEVQRAVGVAFLAVVQAEQAVTAAQADLERRTVLFRAARTLVDNQLRPGAEASRADAERAAADTRAILARQALTLAQTTLARVLGSTAGPVRVNAVKLLDSTPASAPAVAQAGASAAHPLIEARQAAVDLARAHEDVLAAANRPRLYLQSALFARGSGATFNGTLEGGANGLGLERGNWAGGVQVVFPDLFGFSSVRARRAAAAASTRAEAARREEAVIAITTEQQAAAAMIEAARAVAANTPVQLAAARQTETQATARFQAGLGTIVEVADAQNLLAQAEYQDAAARVDVWRALLADAVAHGDLAPFVRLAAEGAR